MPHSQDKIKVIIADDSREFIEGITLLISTMPNIEIIEILHDGEELVRSHQLQEADIVLIDIDMPKMGGLEAARILTFRTPSILLIALTMYLEKVYLEEMIKVGFKGFIHKPEISQNLFDVIDKVLKNKYVFPDYVKMSNNNKMKNEKHED